MSSTLASLRARDWRALAKHHLFWPLAILIVLLLVNLPFTPTFRSATSAGATSRRSCWRGG